MIPSGNSMKIFYISIYIPLMS